MMLKIDIQHVSMMLECNVACWLSVFLCKCQQKYYKVLINLYTAQDLAEQFRVYLLLLYNYMHLLYGKGGGSSEPVKRIIFSVI